MLLKLKKYVDLKLMAIISLVYGMFVIVYASKNIYLRFYANRWENFSVLEFIIGNIIDWILIIIFMMFIAYGTKKLLQKNSKWFFIIIMHLCFSFLIGAFTIGISELISSISNPEKKMSWDIYRLFISYIQLIDLHFLIYVALSTIIYIYYYFQKIQENKLQTIKLQDQLSKTHLKFLQSQMHPHFLFNTLNGIHSLMDINIDKSKSMVVDLSDLLRNVLDKKDENLIELQEELEILEKYINIKKIRFSDHLKFHVSIEEGLENVLVPNMLIQPIVENATKHGYQINNEFLDIYIEIKKENDNLVVEVKNNGKKLTEKPSILFKKGTGLSNLKERLNSLYKDNYKLLLYNNNNFVITEVHFPIQLSISEIPDKY